MYPIHISLLILLWYTTIVYSYNILGFFSAPSISHQITFQPIIKELARRGHKLTVITPNPINDPSIKNLDEIDVQEISYNIWNKYNISSYGAEEEVESTDLSPMISAYKEIIEVQLGHPRIQDLINNSSKYQFDLFLVEYPHTFAGPLKRIYNTSMIGITSMPIHMLGAKYIGNPSHPVLYPDLNLPFSNKLTFWQKVQSFLYSNIGLLLLERYKPIFRNIMASHFSLDLVNEMDDITKEFDLVLVNYNPILFAQRPNVPAVIEFNGIHIQPSKLLPKEMQTFMDNATEGVVYISFGSNIKSSALPKYKIKMIAEALSELPYKFLWKFETNLQNVSKNIQIVKWAPQQDILRHPNTKLFVTQGGLQSLDEAMYTRTPVLVIPFFGDQLGNAQKAAEAGLGKSLQFATLTKEAFKTAIIDIINDKSYTKQMEYVYDILTDQPMPALNKTVWWIEYVLRHKGARHLKCPTVEATVIEYYMLDIFGFLFLVALLALLLVYYVAKALIQLTKKIMTIGSEKLKTN